MVVFVVLAIEEQTFLRGLCCLRLGLNLPHPGSRVPKRLRKCPAHRGQGLGSNPRLLEYMWADTYL